MFKNLVSYCMQSGNPFESYEQAYQAYIKHSSRESLRQAKDPLKVFYKSYHKAVRTYFKKIRKYRAYELYDYNLTEVMEFLKSNKYYGMQCFDCRNICDDPTETVYCKDGVTVEVCHSWGYIEVLGLRSCDFWLLEKAYAKRSL